MWGSYAKPGRRSLHTTQVGADPSDTGACHDQNYWGGNSILLESEKVGGPHTPSEARRIRGREAPEKKRGENLYNWYANGANLGISGKFDLLFHSLAVAYFRAHKNKIE